MDGVLCWGMAVINHLQHLVCLYIFLKQLIMEIFSLIHLVELCYMLAVEQTRCVSLITFSRTSRNLFMYHTMENLCCSVLLANNASIFQHIRTKSDLKHFFFCFRSKQHSCLQVTLIYNILHFFMIMNPKLTWCWLSEKLLQLIICNYN